MLRSLSPSERQVATRAGLVYRSESYGCWRLVGELDRDENRPRDTHLRRRARRLVKLRDTPMTSPENEDVDPQVLPDLRVVSVIHDNDLDGLKVSYDDDLIGGFEALGILIAGAFKHLAYLSDVNIDLDVDNYFEDNEAEEDE